MNKIVLTKNVTLISNINDWIKSFNGNNNPAIKTEIVTGLEILIWSGLDIKKNIPSDYKLDTNFKTCDIFKNIIGIINATQDDMCGGTGDIGIVYKKIKCKTKLDGSVHFPINYPIKYYSVTKNSDNPKTKCINNPSSKQYNIIKEDYSQIINKDVKKRAIEWYSTNHGKNPNNNWKRKRCPEAKKVCEKLALDASNKWNSLENDVKKTKLLHFWDIDKYLNPNTIGIISTSNTGIQDISHWELKMNLDDCLHTISDGIYIYHCTDTKNYKKTWFLKTQVKFNNGIIELPARKKNIPESEWKPKLGDVFGSWNIECKLDIVFDMTTIYSLSK